MTRFCCFLPWPGLGRDLQLIRNRRGTPVSCWLCTGFKVVVMLSLGKEQNILLVRPTFFCSSRLVNLNVDTPCISCGVKFDISTGSASASRVMVIKSLSSTVLLLFRSQTAPLSKSHDMWTQSYAGTCSVYSCFFPWSPVDEGSDESNAGLTLTLSLSPWRRSNFKTSIYNTDYSICKLIFAFSNTEGLLFSLELDRTLNARYWLVCTQLLSLVFMDQGVSSSSRRR